VPQSRSQGGVTTERRPMTPAHDAGREQNARRVQRDRDDDRGEPLELSGEQQHARDDARFQRGRGRDTAHCAISLHRRTTPSGHEVGAADGRCLRAFPRYQGLRWRPPPYLTVVAMATFVFGAVDFLGGYMRPLCEGAAAVLIPAASGRSGVAARRRRWSCRRSRPHSPERCRPHRSGGRAEAAGPAPPGVFAREPGSVRSVAAGEGEIRESPPLSRPKLRLPRSTCRHNSTVVAHRLFGLPRSSDFGTGPASALRRLAA